MVRSEGRDLRQGDIPYFETRTDSRHLWDGQGRDLGPLLAESGMEGIERRLADLAEASTLRQVALVHHTFELRAAEKGMRPRLRSDLGDWPPTPSETGGASVGEASPEACLETAQQIADDLRHRAFIDPRGARWWAPRRLGAGRWTLSEAGPDLYYGVSGLALFYRQLAEIGGRSVDVEMAEATEATLRHQLSLNGERLADLGLRSIGAYSGWGGVLYSLMFLARHGGRDDLLELAEHHLTDVQSLVSVDERFDIVALLRLAALRPASAALDLAERCGERLLAHGQRQELGMGWPPPEGSRGPLAGLSHGAAGIAWALWELAAVTAGESRERYFAAALAAFDYEDGLYDEVRGNWPDLRAKPEEHDDHRLLAWCHGAPGVGLARLASIEALASAGWLDEPLGRRLRRDVQRAVDSTWQRGFGLTHCLCHGDLGNLDFLFEAAAEGFLPAGVHSVAALRRGGGRILASVRTQGCLLGTPGGTDPPGLLVGRAGIGWGLLRLAAPTRVASILRLALPGSVGGSSMSRSGSTGSQAITPAGR
jgi:type 2 lantibiotic biosynthesis protein LanM